MCSNDGGGGAEDDAVGLVTWLRSRRVPVHEVCGTRRCVGLRCLLDRRSQPPYKRVAASNTQRVYSLCRWRGPELRPASPLLHRAAASVTADCRLYYIGLARTLSLEMACLTELSRSKVTRLTGSPVAWCSCRKLVTFVNQPAE